MIGDISDKLEILVPATELILGHRLISRVFVEVAEIMTEKSRDQLEAI
jgi:hypothetical protein